MAVLATLPNVLTHSDPSSMDPAMWLLGDVGAHRATLTSGSRRRNWETVT